MWARFRSHFKGFPAQEKVAQLMVVHGLRVRDGNVLAGEIKISDTALARAAGVDRIDAGEKAVVVSLHDNKFAKPEKLIAWLQKNAPLVRLRPDHRVIVQRVWNDERQRLSGVTSIVSLLAKLAA